MTHPDGRKSPCPCGTFMAFDRICGMWWCEDCPRIFVDGTEPRPLVEADLPRAPSRFNPRATAAYLEMMGRLTSHANGDPP